MSSSTSERFAFGANWQRFLRHLDEQRIVEAERSLQDSLGFHDLTGKTVIDVGSGSGLFSLAAMRLGAARVRSLDYDPDSVACTEMLRDRFFPDAENWTVERGDATDPGYMRGLGRFDLVYSWGVLHHTGQMWKALDNAGSLVAADGTLFISIYNDQGTASRVWKVVKRLYNSSPPPGRALVFALAGGQLVLRMAILAVVNRDIGGFLRNWRRTDGRGMSGWYDLVDWVGGYPFEVARPDEIFDFFRERGFRLRNLTTTTSHGVNEYVFTVENSADRRSTTGSG